MEPYKADKLPIDYKIDKDLLKLLSEANEKYGEYKTLLNSAKFDSKYFLNSILLSESIKSSQIEGTQISQDEMYYLKYYKKTDDSREIENLKDTIDLAISEIKQNNKIDLTLLNKMHSVILNSVRGSDKDPGKIRTTQNWIGSKGMGIEAAIFIPPIPEEIYMLMTNLLEYMNDNYIDPILINLAISHAQFETIHPYKDGNGRIGRAIIPIQLAVLTEEKPILFLSEVIELYKPTYQRTLMDSRKGNISSFIKFFLQCIIEQCTSYIYKIKEIEKIYNDDIKKIEQIKGNAIYKVMPIINKQVIFTKKEIENETGLSKNTVSGVINKLIMLGIVVPDNDYIKRAYKYKKIYDVFVGMKEYI